MRTIWKFPLAWADTLPVSIPKGATVLSVQIQNGLPTAWASVDSTAPRIDRVVTMVGTGWDLEQCDVTKDLFIGTVQTGPYVWHFFIEPEHA